MFTPRIALGCSLLSLFVFIVLNTVLLSASNELPKIQGVIVPEGRDLRAFELRDHNGKIFSNRQLLGKWSLMSYGFSDCPDICPTTLSKLALFANKLDVLEKRNDLQMLFYTVDPQRDTIEHLANYVSFFHEDLIGLSYSLALGTNHIPLEQSLGIVAAITPLSEEEAKYDYKGYGVSHGVVLFLINPKGQLQAIFKPKLTDHGLHYFDTETVLQDYLALRDYFG